MKLELHKIHVSQLRFGPSTGLEGSCLTINAEELRALLLEDSHLADVELDIAHPGDSVRIMPVKDAIEPRCKLEGPGEVFPGFIGPVETVGEGKTLVLEGMCVLTTGRLVAAQEGIVDMSGPGADYTPFSRTCNLAVVLHPREDVKLHEAEHACRIAGLKAAHYLAAHCKEHPADTVESYEAPSLREGLGAHGALPKVAYIYMLQSQGLLHDTWVYGVDAKRILPTLISPTEIMDGAIISGNCVSACDKNNTYVHLNNPIIRALYDRHGKELNFVGVVITNENVTLADKQRSSDWTAKLCRLLDLDGVIVSQEGFGNPDTDLIMNTKKIELQGVKTTIITDEYAGQDGKSQSLADADPLADAVVTGGNANEVIVLPKMDKVIGMLDYVDVIAGGHAGSLRPDGTIEAELQVITGATNEMGFNRLSAR